MINFENFEHFNTDINNSLIHINEIIFCIIDDETEYDKFYSSINEICEYFDRDTSFIALECVWADIEKRDHKRKIKRLQNIADSIIGEASDFIDDHEHDQKNFSRYIEIALKLKDEQTSLEQKIYFLEQDGKDICPGSWHDYSYFKTQRECLYFLDAYRILQILRAFLCNKINPSFLSEFKKYIKPFLLQFHGSIVTYIIHNITKDDYEEFLKYDNKVVD